jgi:serine protease
MTFTRGGSAGQPLGASYAPVKDADEDNIEGYASTGADVVVGDIDTGVQLNHPEFTGRLIVGRDFYNNDADPSDDNGHGTHTTGTIAGKNVGVAGVAGAAAHVKVHVQKVCGRRGCPSAAMASAIRTAADVPGMVAVNLSIGGSSESQAEKDAIAYAKSKGVLVIASAGNDATGTVSCPACDVNAISVAATQWQDKLASYSNWGSGLDIAAPGGNCYSNTTAEGCIFSAIWSGNSGAITTTVNGTTSTYGWMQGTSMAAPQVTGTAAVVASMVPELNPSTSTLTPAARADALRNRLLNTADDKGAAGYDTSFGNGRLNTYSAVKGVKNSLGPGL